MKFKLLFVLLLSVTLLGCGKEELKEVKVPDDTIITFKDKALESIVREKLGIKEEDITSKDMLDLTQFSAHTSGVKDLSGLEYAKNLEYFSLFTEKVNSLDPISNLKNLKRIVISYSEINDLPISFSKDVKLTEVTFIDTKVKDINFLKDMETLEDVGFTDCGIKNIDALEKATNLYSVSLEKNEIESIKSLTNKQKLYSLSLHKNKVNDVSPLTDLKSLEYINLSYNPVTNLKALESLPKLKELTIYKDHDVKHLIFDQVDKLISSGVEVLYHK